MDCVGIWLGNGDGSFQDQKDLTTGFFSYPVSISVGDFNQDNNIDIAVRNTQRREEHVFILIGDGYGNFIGHGKYITGTDLKLSSVAVGNFNGDYHLDIVIANNGTKSIGVFHGNGDGIFATQTRYTMTDGSHPISIAIGDFNNDNRVNTVVVHSGTENVGILLRIENGALRNSRTYIQPGLFRSHMY